MRRVSGRQSFLPGDSILETSQKRSKRLSRTGSMFQAVWNHRLERKIRRSSARSLRMPRKRSCNMSVRMIRSVFLLCAAVFLTSAHAVDVKRFEVLKGIHFFQIEDGVSHLQTNNAYRFTVQVYADVVGDVLGSSVFTPKIPRIDLLPDKDGDPYRFRDKFDDQFGLENNFPNGTYQLGIRGLHDGDHTMSFSLADDVYPAAPIVNDYAGLQNLVYNEYNQISWQPFAGGGVNDFIQLQIEDLNGNNIWETPDFGEDGALDGTA